MYASKKVEDHMEQFNKFDFLWKLEKRQQLDSFLKSNPTLDDFISRLSKYQEIEKENLNVPIILQKCIQAYQLSTVRNGISFLGQSFCGKSLCCRTLAQEQNSD